MSSPIVKSLPNVFWLVIRKYNGKRKKTYLWPKRRQHLLGFFFCLIAILFLVAIVIAHVVVVCPPLCPCHLALSSCLIAPCFCPVSSHSWWRLGVLCGGGGSSPFMFSPSWCVIIFIIVAPHIPVSCSSCVVPHPVGSPSGSIIIIVVPLSLTFLSPFHHGSLSLCPLHPCFFCHASFPILFQVPCGPLSSLSSLCPSHPCLLFIVHCFPSSCPSSSAASSPFSILPIDPCSTL